MTIERLQAHLHAQPFKPFRVHLADGREVDVRHPDFAAFGGGRTFVVYTGKETAETIDLLLVASLETINGPLRTRRGNGRK